MADIDKTLPNVKQPEEVVNETEENINIVVQINGKKRALLKLMPNTKEEELFEIICKEKSIKKYLDNKIIKRKIFIKDKLFNIIV